MTVHAKASDWQGELPEGCASPGGGDATSATVRPGYRKTEVGVIPEDWRVEPIERISTVGRGRVISHRVIARSLNPRYPVYSSQTSNNGVMGYLDTFEFEGEYVTWTTDGANAGTVFARDGRFNCTNVCGTIKLKSDNHYFVAEVLGRIAPRHVSRHLGNPKLMNDVMKRINIPLPPTVFEQGAIAEALSEADALIESLEQLLAKKRHLKQGAMQELLTGKRRLPGFSGEWEVRALGEIAVASKGSQLGSNEVTEHGRFAHLNGGISASGYTDKSNASGDTIAISEGGNSCGYVQFMSDPYWCGGHCYSVIPNRVGNRFLYHALKVAEPAIMRLRVGSGLPNVQKTALLAFTLRLPKTSAEQTAIATILSDMDTEIAALESKLVKARQLKQGMMQELLTGRIRLV